MIAENEIVCFSGYDRLIRRVMCLYRGSKLLTSKWFIRYMNTLFHVFLEDLIYNLSSLIIQKHRPVKPKYCLEWSYYIYINRWQGGARVIPRTPTDCNWYLQKYLKRVTNCFEFWTRIIWSNIFYNNLLNHMTSDDPIRCYLFWYLKKKKTVFVLGKSIIMFSNPLSVNISHNRQTYGSGGMESIWCR